MEEKLTTVRSFPECEQRAHRIYAAKNQCLHRKQIHRVTYLRCTRLRRNAITYLDFTLYGVTTRVWRCAGTASVGFVQVLRCKMALQEAATHLRYRPLRKCLLLRYFPASVMSSGARHGYPALVVEGVLVRDQWWRYEFLINPLF